MNAQWEAYQADIEGHEAWILFNAGIARELKSMDLPNLLSIQVEFTPATPEGLPSGEEEERLHDLEGELESWIAAIGGRYAGQVTIAGLRTMFFYVSCGKEEAENLIRRIALRKNMDLGFRMQADPSNRTYFELLLPTHDERRQMRDLATIAGLSAQGDDLQTPRPIAHSARFGNRHQAIAFANWARKNRFIVDGIRSPAREGDDFTLLFHKTMPPLPEIIDADTAAISHTTGQLGGQYDGWQAELRTARTG